MVARLLRLALVALFAAALGWGVFWWQRGRPLLALFGALAISGVHAIILAIEFAALAVVNRADPAPAASAEQLLRAWWAETWIAALVFGWRQPFRSQRHADHVVAARRRGVVLVHGFFCNRGVWNPWMPRLHADGVPFIAVNLEAVFASIDDCVPVVDQAVQRLEQATGLAPVIVAHSMGGLVVRAWLDSCAGDARVFRVVTIGTPHQGTWLARFAVGANTRQMRRAGEWLGALAGREPPARAGRFTCFYSHCDNVVLPASTAMLPGADNRHLPGVAHVQMALHADVLAELTRCLAIADADAAMRRGVATNAR